MKIIEDAIKDHKQIKDCSCVAMSIECILKMLRLMPPDSYHYQETTPCGQNAWALSRDIPNSSAIKRIRFSYLFNNPDRGQKWMELHYNDLFNTIDAELAGGRYVIISLATGYDNNEKSNQWHMVIIYDKVNHNEYDTVTWYHHTTGPQYIRENLRDRVTKMQGTDILTYNISYADVGGYGIS